MGPALMDFGARSYDPFTACWTSIDPLAHKYHALSPYNYCGGNPVMYFEPDGMGNIDWKTVGEGSALIAGGTVAVAGTALADFGTGGFAALATAGLITNGILARGTGMTMVAAGFIDDQLSNVPQNTSNIRQESPSWVEEVQKNYPIYLDWSKYDGNKK